MIIVIVVFAILSVSFVIALCKSASRQIPTDGETRELEHHLMQEALKRGSK